MRISDWSSDVCSSDLARTFRRSLSPCGTPDILPYRSAVIDIGSNSVRLVVYEGPPRAPAVIFNEKVHAGLGRGVSIDGRIADEDAARGLYALRRYALLARPMGVQNLTCIAPELGRASCRERVCQSVKITVV